MVREEMIKEKILNYFYLRKNFIRIGIVLADGKQIEKYL